jgi:hypothetical protein
LLVKIGVERDAALLHEHAAEMFRGIEGVSADVAFHDGDALVVVVEMKWIRWRK